MHTKYIAMIRSSISDMDIGHVLYFPTRTVKKYKLQIATVYGITYRRYQVSTDFEPVDARSAFPCLDEPDQKGKWTITVRAFRKL